jgi:hypothetical protein
MFELLVENYQIQRVAIEIISAVACFVLFRFMIKPYTVTREGRYIGLPLGFGFLGASYVISAIAYTQPNFYGKDLMWFQLLARGFSFVFLAVAYYFSKKPSKNTRLIWDITFSGLFVCLTALALLIFIAPQIPITSYQTINISVRVIDIFCLSYICIHCIREHAKEPDPISIWVLCGYALLGISQYAYLIAVVDSSDFPFWGSITLRLMSFAVFLFVTYRTFYSLKKKRQQP